MSYQQMTDFIQQCAFGYNSFHVKYQWTKLSLHITYKQYAVGWIESRDHSSVFVKLLNPTRTMGFKFEDTNFILYNIHVYIYVIII